MEKMQTGQRIITTLPVHGHQNRLIYALTMLLIAKIIIFWLLGIRQGGYELGTSGSWAIAFPHALLGISGDYSGNNGKMDWGPSISGNTTKWSAGGAGSGIRVIAIGY